MKRKKIHIRTFGCQMNVHDSEQLMALMAASGYEASANAKKADIIVVNTCSIREKAEQKIVSQLGRFRQQKMQQPDLKICVGGCLAQQLGKRFLKRVPYIDVVFGTHQIHRLPDLIRSAEIRNSPVVETSFEESVKSIGIHVLPEKGQVSAFVTIMQGCDNYCAYCVVPYVRGREESRKCIDIAEEVKFLAGNGIKDVTLLGQNVNSYGKTNGGGPDFVGLLQEIQNIDGIERIRFTTSHPRDFSDELIDCFGKMDKLCEHIHLPVQSGSDRVLEMMKRDYTRADYLRKVEKLRNVCPQISITSDLIVGFPGETDEDFHDTIDLMKTVRFDGVFSFKYSERECTEAQKLEDQVGEAIKSERLRILQDIQQKHTLEKNMALKGCIEDVLVDGFSKNNGSEVAGRTRSNKIVNFSGNRDMIGATVSVLITEGCQNSLRGVLHKRSVTGRVNRQDRMEVQS